MKIRTGFVSNSSSSSFCIVGARINTAKLLEEVKKLDKEDDINSIFEDQKENIILRIKNDNKSSFDDKIKLLERLNTGLLTFEEKSKLLSKVISDGERLNDFFESKGLVSNNYSYDFTYVGLPFSRMRDDETLGQFKARVKSLIGFLKEEDKMILIEEVLGC